MAVWDIQNLSEKVKRSGKLKKQESATCGMLCVPGGNTGLLQKGLNRQQQGFSFNHNKTKRLILR